MFAFDAAVEVADHIVCITLKGDVWKTSPHPVVERVVQKQIGQQRTDDTTVGCAARPSMERGASYPAIPPEPPTSAADTEQPFDIEIHDPAIFPAVLTAALNGLVADRPGL